MLESRFQAELIDELKERFVGCIVLKNDTSYLQGFPDLLVLFYDRWAALEVKPNRSARRQPNQEYYVDVLDDMSFATFISPENKEAVLDELQQAFRTRGSARFSRR